MNQDTKRAVTWPHCHSTAQHPIPILTVLLAVISAAATGHFTLAVSFLFLPLVPLSTSLPKSVVSLRDVSVSVKPAKLSTFVTICLDFSPANFISHN